MSTVTKSILTDFGGNFNSIVFHTELKTDAIISPKYISFTRNDDVLVITLLSTLTTLEDTQLNYIITNHDYNKDLRFREPNTYYVSPIGDDNNHGQSAFQPFKTIKKASLAVAASGGKNLIRILPGNYYESNPIQLIDQTSVISVGQTPSVHIYPLNQNANLFELTGSGSMYGLNMVNLSNGIMVNYNSTGGTIWRLVNMVMENCKQAVRVAGNSGILYISECILKNISTNGMTVGLGGQLTIMESKMYLISGAAVKVEDDTGRLEVESYLIQGANVGIEVRGTARITDGDVVQCNTGSILAGNSPSPSYKGMRIFNCGVGIEIGGTNISPLYGDIEVRNSVYYDGIINATSGYIMGSGNIIDDTKILNTTMIPIYQNFINNNDTDKGTNFVGTVNVGTHNAPAESIFGEGNSHTKGMSIITIDENGTTNDISSGMKILEGEENIFATPNVNSSVYIGGDYKFTGIKIYTGSVPINYGASGSIDWYISAVGNTFTDVSATLSNGQVLPLCLHLRDANSPYLHHNSPTNGSCNRKPDLFGRANSSEQAKFGFYKDWAKTTINGIEKYWFKIMITNTLTTIPKVNKIKLGTNRLEIEEDGFVQEYGNAVAFKKLGCEWNNFKPSSLFVSPTTTTLYKSQNHAISALYNTFSPSIKSGLSYNTMLPEDFDNSLPIVLRLRYVFDTTPSVNDKVLMKVIYGYTNENDVLYTSSSGLPNTCETTYYPVECTQDQVNGVFTTLPITGIPMTEREMVFALDMCHVRVTKDGDDIFPDNFWISIIREGNDASDTYPGKIIFHLIHAIYPSSFGGVHKYGLPSIGLF